MSDTIAFTINSSFSAKPGGFSAYLDPGSALSEKFSKEKSWQNEIGILLNPSEIIWAKSNWISGMISMIINLKCLIHLIH